MNQDSNNDAKAKIIEHLEDELKRLKEDIDKSYYRIPKQEFENITVKKITNDVLEMVNRKIGTYRNFIGAILIILSFLGITNWISFTNKIEEKINNVIDNKVSQINNKIDNEVKNEVKGTIDRFNETLDLIDRKQQQLQTNIDQTLDNFSKNINVKASSAAKEETDRQVLALRDDMKLAQITASRTELNYIKKDLADNTITLEKAIERLNVVLDKVLKLNEKELASEYLDALFLWTYQNANYENLDSLRMRYENDYEFSYSSWANIAIGNLMLYEETNTPIYQKRAISAIDNSLKKQPNYGTPQAVRLMIHMLDYKRTNDSLIKASELKAAEELINRVNTGSRKITSYETYNYLIGALTSRFKEHIQLLLDNFPEEMEFMHKRCEDYEQLLNSQKLD